MKILVCISSYGLKQQNHLYTLLEEYNKMSFNIDVIVYTTLDNNIKDKYNNLKITEIINSDSIGENNAYLHRKDVISNKDNYDLFIYTENDHLITQANIDTYLKVSENLDNTNYITGFIQYELKPNNDTKYTIVMIKNFDRERANFTNKKIMINNKKYFSIQNLHQGSWILTKSQLDKCINSGNFKTHQTHGGYGLMESACTDPYSICGFKKVFPYEDLENLFIHHLPNKYINTVERFVTFGTLSLNDMLKYKDE